MARVDRNDFVEKVSLAATASASAGRITVLSLALLLSGAAGLINQTVWQRAIKVRLAGSEAISSMIVVLVFLAGLGAGSILMGRKANRVRDPLRLLAVVESALCATTLMVAFILGLDVAESVDVLRRLASNVGVPLPLFSAVSSALLLLGPCLLMGMTLPLASEGAQRQLRVQGNAFLARVFCVNTLGAVAGVLAGGMFLLPFYGQRDALLLAASANLATGLLVLGARRGIASGTSASDAGPRPWRGRIRTEEWIAFALGFLALGYEMYLFRMIALTNTPLPYNFAAALCGYLFWWSLGALAAGWVTRQIGLVLTLTVLAVMGAPFAARYLSYNHASIIESSLVLTLPCLGFGMVFAWMLQRMSASWGNDVGRFHGINTLGSAIGILVVTLVGYEYSPTVVVVLLGLGYLALLAWILRERLAVIPLIDRRAVAFLLVSAVAVGAWNVVEERRVFDNPKQHRVYYGREGVVEILNDQTLIWDGLYHSNLTSKGTHVGSANWLLATVPLLSRRWQEPVETLVIGLGAGITAGTLARSDAVGSVDVYELNPRLRELLADYPDGTLNVATNPKVHINWGDGRTGLAISDKKYDLITQQPLYLKQAGSSILLSREYMQLLRKHLKPGGVVCLYCNSLGHNGQATVVRKTATTVFRYGESFGHGYMLILSDTPLDYPSPGRLADVLAGFGASDVVGNELRRVPRLLASYHDDPRLEWNRSPVLVTDDHPIVEYPDVADYRVATFQNQTRQR